MIQRVIVFFTAMGLRRGLSVDEMHAALLRAFPWRDAAWRWDTLGAAQARNRRKLIDA